MIEIIWKPLSYIGVTLSIIIGIFWVAKEFGLERYLKKFLRGCVNGLLVLLTIGIFALGIYLTFSALEYRTWGYIVGLGVYAIFLFGLNAVVD